MMRDETLQITLLAHVKAIAQDRATEPSNRDRAALAFSDTFHADLDNGEGIIGYQYLHGTNRTVGDFGLHGSSTVARGVGAACNADGTTVPGETVVEVKAQYRWNDIIDPNPQYDTDRVKNVLAEINQSRKSSPNTEFRSIGV